MYAYEIDPQRDFQPDVFIDIADVLPSVIETINFFRKLNAERAGGRERGTGRGDVEVHTQRPRAAADGLGRDRSCAPPVSAATSAACASLKPTRRSTPM